MLNQPVKASDLDVVIFSGAEHNDNIEEFQVEVNSWLKNQPGNIVVHDVIYNHKGRTAKGKDIVSVVILSSPVH